MFYGGLLFYFMVVYFLNLAVAFAFATTYQYVPIVNNFLNINLFQGSIEFREEYISFLFGNMQKKMRGMGFLATNLALGSYTLFLESQKTDLIADRNFNSWVHEQKGLGKIPTIAEAVQKRQLFKEESINEDTIGLKSIKKGSEISKKTLDRLWKEIEENTPK